MDSAASSAADSEEQHFSCLSHGKLDKQVRRQVRRVTSAAVTLMQVVSPAVLTKKKFSTGGEEADTITATTTLTNKCATSSPARGGGGLSPGVIADRNRGGLNHHPQNSPLRSPGAAVTAAETGVLSMDPTSNAERIVQCVHKHHHHQEGRMLGPLGETGSPDIDCGVEYRGSYRYCSPKNFPRTTTVLRPVSDEVVVEHATAAGVAPGAKKSRGKKVRSLSMSVICNEHNFGFPADADCHTAPLMCLHEEASLGEEGAAAGTGAGGCCQEHARKAGVRRNHPLRRQMGSLFGCFLGSMRREHGERKMVWDRSTSNSSSGSSNRRALALLELSRRQQNALAMKQDTIELLQWKLEQLQLLSSAAGVNPPVSSLGTTHHSNINTASVHHPVVGDFPDLHFIPPAVIAGGFSKCCPADIEDDLKTRQDHHHHHHHHHRICSPHRQMVEEQHQQPQQQPYLQSTVKLENAELAAILHLFDVMVVKARLAVRYFCKVFMKQMEISGYSVWRTLSEIEPRTKFLKKEHTAFILESRLNKALYHCFENDSFDETGLTRIIDPEKRCIVRFRDFQRLKPVDAPNAVNSQHEDFDQEFWQFSENKMREMWFLFPWNVVFKDSQERSSFTAAFLDAAKCVWLLHRLAFSIYPNVTILRVGKGMHANSQYVEQVAHIEDGCAKCEGPKVEFMSMPGFQVRKKIIKCQVYLHLQCK